jgi:hypothetical protein
MKLLRTEIPKALIGWSVTGVLGLSVLCIMTIYQSYEHMMSSSREAIVQIKRDSEQAQRLGEFTKSTSPVMERSMDRSLQLRKLAGYKKHDTLDEQTNNFWHNLSATSRMEATHDLADLDRYSEDTFPLSTPIKDGLKGLLKSEINLWEKVDRYIDSKSSVPKNEMVEEEAFQVFTSAFLEHSKSIGSIQSLYMQTADRVLISKKDAQSRYERYIYELDQTRRKSNLAFAGLAITLLVVTAFATFLFYPSLKRKPVSSERRTRKQKQSKRS